MKVTSKKTISFPKFKWGINKNENRELPEDKEAQEAILSHPAISEAGKTTPKVEGEDKKDNKTNKN